MGDHFDSPFAAVRIPRRENVPVVVIPADGVVLRGNLATRPGDRGIVIFAHGSGRRRFGRRNRHAHARKRRFWALLFLATPREDAEDADAMYCVLQQYVLPAWRDTARWADIMPAVWRGAPAAAIVRAAQQYGADRIVMTTHGRMGTERDVFGSVADAVLRSAPMSVIVIRPRREVTRPAAGGAEPATAETR